MRLALTPPVTPMLAAAVSDLDAVGGDVSWEPKLDGFRCLVWRDGDEVELQGRSGTSLTRWFPELLGPLRHALPGRVVIDGELVVPVDGRLDFDALSARIHPAASRVAHLSETTPAHLVAFDVLALGDRSLLEQPWMQRRATLDQILGAVRSPVHLCPTSAAREDAATWFAVPVGGDLDGVVAKPLHGAYEPGGRGWSKVKHRHTIDLVVGGYRLHQDGEGIASLLLGLVDGAGTLHYVGATRALAARERRDLYSEMLPLVSAADEAHPWVGDPAGRTPGEPSRWSRGRSTAWVPIRPERVVECEVEGLIAGRLRSNAKVLRWRDDRDPASCRYDQLEALPTPGGGTAVIGWGA